MVRKSVGTNQFASIVAPFNGADLRLGVDFLQTCARLGVVEAQMPIGRASTRGQKRRSRGVPRQRLDGRLEILDAQDRLGRTFWVPDHDAIVIGSRGQLPLIRRPSQAADLQAPDSVGTALA